MAATDARPVPRKNVAYRVTFPILDADGDLVTGAATLDSEVSIDGAAFADCTNEATEIATSSGMYYLDLTSGEMNGDTVAIIVKTGTAGAKTTAMVMYPEESGDYRADVTHFGGTAGTFSAGRPEVNTTHVGGTAQTANDNGADINAILADTGTDGVVVAAASKTGYTLTATTGLGNQTANITGNLSGSVGSVTGLTASDVGAIKAKTDSLTFTVAGQVDANVQSINDVTITGNGQTGTEFGV